MEHTFTLTITGQLHYEWQGLLQREDSPPMEFRSVMELLKLIDNQLEGNT